jgi:hypothetical protein
MAHTLDGTTRVRGRVLVWIPFDAGSLLSDAGELGNVDVHLVEGGAPRSTWS